MSYVPPRLLAPPVDASRVPGVDRPDTMGDPTGFGEAQVMGMRVANATPDKMDSTLKPSSAMFAGEDDGLHAILSHFEPLAKRAASTIYPHLDDEQRAEFHKRIAEHIPQASIEVQHMFPTHTGHMRDAHQLTAASPAEMAPVERLVAAKSVLHVLNDERMRMQSGRRKK